MTIEAALYTYLSGYAGLTALVSTRIYPMARIQVAAATEDVTYEIDQDHRYQQMSGQPTGTKIILRVTAFGRTSVLVKAVAAQLYAALQGFTGVMGGAGGVNIGSCLHEDAVDDYDDNTSAFMVTQEFGIIYKF